MVMTGAIIMRSYREEEGTGTTRRREESNAIQSCAVAEGVSRSNIQQRRGGCAAYMAVPRVKSAATRQKQLPLRVTTPSETTLQHMKRRARKAREIHGAEMRWRECGVVHYVTPATLSPFVQTARTRHAPAAALSSCHNIICYRRLLPTTSTHHCSHSTRGRDEVRTPTSVVATALYRRRRFAASLARRRRRTPPTKVALQTCFSARNEEAAFYHYYYVIYIRKSSNEITQRMAIYSEESALRTAMVMHARTPRRARSTARLTHVTKAAKLRRK